MPIHPLRSSHHMRCRASVANHSMMKYIAAGCSGLAPPEVASNDTPIPSPRTPLVDTPVGDSGDRRCLPGCMSSCTCDARSTSTSTEMRHQQLTEFQNAHGLDTQSALCIERGLLLRRALNQLKANKVHGFSTPVQGVGCVNGMSIQNAVGICCRPHLTICCRCKMLIPENRVTVTTATERRGDSALLWIQLILQGVLI